MMNESFAKSNNKVLKALLQKWITVLKIFIKETNGEMPPWFYIERADVSFLAAAVWKSGGVAIEELPIPKEKQNKNTRNQYGRGDLFFLLKGRKYYCEAKSFRYPRTQHALEHCSAEIQEFLLQSTNDLSKVKIPCKKLALFFQVPQFKEDQKHFIERWKNEARTYKGTGVAYYFPSKVKSENGIIFPGIILYVDELAK